MKLKFELPTDSELDSYYTGLLKEFPAELRDLKRIYSISYAEAKDITFRAVKNKIIEIEESKGLGDSV